MPIWIPMAIAAGISAASQIIGSRKAAQTARINTNLTIQENKKLADLAYERDQQALKAMNEYNSPKSQMQRFTDAGLNRALIYTQGNAGNQSQLIKYNPPSVQYNYEPNFRGTEFNSIKDLPLQYHQIKNLASIGKMNEAKAVMEQALSRYAQLIARGKAEAILTEMSANELKKLFNKQSLITWFEPVEDSTGNPYWKMKPGMEEKFTQDIITKLLTPTTNLEKSQADLKLKDQILKNLSFLPWLQPLLQFANMFR